MVWGEGFSGWLRQNQPEHLRLGRLGERAAKRHLKQAGLKFLYANFKGEQGEIDLVFREVEVLVFVEVKARSSESWTRPAAAVDCAGAGTARSRNPCASFGSRFAWAHHPGGDRASRQKCEAGYCGPICRRCFRDQDPAGPATGEVFTL